jgi:hypothetical protein
MVSAQKWVDICRYTLPELLFAPKFHTGTYQYVLYHLCFFSQFFGRYTFDSLLRSMSSLLNFHFEHCLLLKTRKSAAAWYKRVRTSLFGLVHAHASRYYKIQKCFICAPTRTVCTLYLRTEYDTPDRSVSLDTDNRRRTAAMLYQHRPIKVVSLHHAGSKGGGGIALNHYSPQH